MNVRFAESFFEEALPQSLCWWQVLTFFAALLDHRRLGVRKWVADFVEDRDAARAGGYPTINTRLRRRKAAITYVATLCKHPSPTAAVWEEAGREADRTTYPDTNDAAHHAIGTAGRIAWQIAAAIKLGGRSWLTREHQKRARMRWGLGNKAGLHDPVAQIVRYAAISNGFATDLFRAGCEVRHEGAMREQTRIRWGHLERKLVGFHPTQEQIQMESLSGNGPCQRDDWAWDSQVTILAYLDRYVRLFEKCLRSAVAPAPLAARIRRRAAPQALPPARRSPGPRGHDA